MLAWQQIHAFRPANAAKILRQAMQSFVLDTCADRKPKYPQLALLTAEA